MIQNTSDLMTDHKTKHPLTEDALKDPQFEGQRHVKPYRER